MTSFPETIIELYDEEQIYNILATIEFKPKNVVFIGTRKLKNKKTKNNIISALRALGLDTKCFFYSTDMLSIEAVRAELENVLTIFGECAVDLTGGGEVAIVALGMLAKERELPLFTYDRYARVYRNVCFCPAADGKASDPHLNINAFLALAGGVMKSHGHVALDGLDADTAKDIFCIWEIYKKYHRVWSRTVTYLQQISKDLEGEELHIDASAVIYGGDKISGVDKTVMSELCGAGLILDYKNDGKRVSFNYKNTLIRSCLCDIGICLELYVYAASIVTGLYDDVQISVVIDWDGDLGAKINTVNEIDVVLTRGIIPVFISCKSGSVNTMTLNEIKTLAVKFGGSHAKAVLVTMSDVRVRDKYLMQRAADMGIHVIDRTDLLSERLSKRLYSISNP